MNKEQIKVSVIVPLYNTPKEFFRRCIDSISNQQHSNIEIIVIDDGSKSELHNEYKTICSSYENAKLIKQKNSGVSEARNKGITLVTGDYVAFVDGDDTIRESFLFEALQYTINKLPDLIIGQIQYIPHDKKFDYGYGEVYISEHEIDSLKKAMLGISQDYIEYPVLGSPCGKLYKKEILEKIKFPKGVSHWEDQIFNRKIIKYVKSAVITSRFWYNYYQNDFSAMHNNFNRNYIKNAKPFWLIWNELNMGESDTDIVKELNKKNINFFYAAIHLNLLYYQIPWSEKKYIIRELLKEPIFMNTIQELKYSNLDGIRDKIRLFGMKHRLYAFMYFIVGLKAQFK